MATQKLKENEIQLCCSSVTVFVSCTGHFFFLGGGEFRFQLYRL